MLTIAIFLLLIIKAAEIILNYRSREKETPGQPEKEQVVFENLFEGYYMEGKSFYFYLNHKAPLVLFIDNIEGKQIAKSFVENNKEDVKAIYKREDYDWKEEENDYSRTMLVLHNTMIVDAFDDCVYLLYQQGQEELVARFKEEFLQYKSPQKEDDFEINIITINRTGTLELKRLEIKPTLLDVAMYYNDDFAQVDKEIKERLLKENDKGIVLLYGLPGTGKTTYLRHLIGEMKKRVLFVSPSVASNLMNPDFVGLLIDNPNCVLVIEDAENILMDRRYNSHSSVSNLLNLSDGLLSDCLNVQIICTFNSAINTVDSALLRKGRLIAQYEFGRLEVTKARALSSHLGIEQEIYEPMTLAEITNPGKSETQPQDTAPQIGFRRAAVIEC